MRHTRLVVSLGPPFSHPYTLRSSAAFRGRRVPALQCALFRALSHSSALFRAPHAHPRSSALSHAQPRSSALSHTHPRSSAVLAAGRHASLRLPFSVPPSRSFKTPLLRRRLLFTLSSWPGGRSCGRQTYLFSGVYGRLFLPLSSTAVGVCRLSLSLLRRSRSPAPDLVALTPFLRADWCSALRTAFGTVSRLDPRDDRCRVTAPEDPAGISGITILCHTSPLC